MGSHLRKEKNCLNCGAEITDRYCAHCGQENLVPKETIGHLIQHFIADLTHYDSQLVTTIRDLLFKPGFLTREYLAGRRIRYLNPVRMYFFISFLFFIVLFSQKSREDKTVSNKPIVQNLNLAKQYLADSLKKSLNNRKASTEASLRDSILADIASKLDTSVIPIKKDEFIGFSISPKGFLFTLVESRYNNVPEYDSVQKTLPEKQRDGSVLSLFIRKNISIKKRLGNSSQISVQEEFQHNVPKLMFILLPLFALLLLLFYRKKKKSYAEHIIFSIHYHSFAFLVLLSMNLLTLILPWFTVGVIVLLLSLFVLLLYLAVALRNVYGQSRLISWLKAIAIAIIYNVLLILSLLVWAVVIFFTA